MLSTAHIFYLPVLVLVGVFIGYYTGRYHQDIDKKKKLRSAKRKTRTPKS